MGSAAHTGEAYSTTDLTRLKKEQSKEEQSKLTKSNHSDHEDNVAKTQRVCHRVAHETAT